MKRSAVTWAALALVAGLAPLLGSGPPAQGGDFDAVPPSLATCYMHEPWAGVRTLRIRRVGGPDLTAEFDANVVRFDPLGNETARTQMEPRRVPATLTLLERSTDGARVFQLTGDALDRALADLGLPDHSLRLRVGGSDCGPWRLLVLDAGGAVVRVFALERANPAP